MPHDPQTLRRQFRLPSEDETFLNSLGRAWEAMIAGSERWVIIRNMELPAGYDRATADVAILMAPGYPPGPLDMAYFNPPILRANGTAPQTTEHRVQLDGSGWQRWSRHRTSENPWMPGEDNLESHYFFMRAWLVDELKR